MTSVFRTTALLFGVGAPQMWGAQFRYNFGDN